MPNLTNADYRKNSFEPRIAIVQLIFGIIYAFVTGVGVILAFKVYEATNEQPYMQYFFGRTAFFMRGKRCGKAENANAGYRRGRGGDMF